MIYLNYTHLDAETQERLISQSKAEIEAKYGNDLKAYAIENGLGYADILEEEAIKNLYNYTYTFRI